MRSVSMTFGIQLPLRALTSLGAARASAADAARVDFERSARAKLRIVDTPRIKHPDPLAGGSEHTHGPAGQPFDCGLELPEMRADKL